MGIGVRRPAGRPASLAFDAAIVVALTALYQWQVWTMGTVAGPRWLTALVVPLLIDLPLLWRRTVPLLVLTLVFVGIDLQAVVTGNAAESLGTFGSALVAAYSVTRYGDRRRGLLAIPIVLVGAVVHDLEDPEVRTSSQIQGSLMFWLVLVAAWLIGIWVRSRHEEADLARHAQEVEREAEAAVAAERARIARELHDIVSHNLSVVVLQAAGARAVEERRLGMVGGTLEKIEHSGRAALIEMRRLLGVLREDPGAPDTAPNPGLAELRDLVAGLRPAGLDVDLDMQGDFDDVPEAVTLSVYRIVQEALTNALKHAAPASARVRLLREQSAVDILVKTAQAAAAAPRPVPGTDSWACGSGLRCSAVSSTPGRFPTAAFACTRASFWKTPPGASGRGRISADNPCGRSVNPPMRHGRRRRTLATRKLSARLAW